MSSRDKFEQAIKARFGDLIDYRTCKNSDGEYMAWDMQVAWWAWQAAETDMAVQLANAESKCRDLAGVAAEHAALKKAADFATAPDMWIEQADGMLDYRYCEWYVDVLKAAMETPATDAFLAEVQASSRNEGINYAASRLAAAYNHGFIDKPLAEVSDVVRMILDAKDELANATIPPADGLSGEYAEKSLAEFAAQIRKGAAL
ncbi:TPA: hypothetical protein ACPYV3_003148 [Citrobacter freundii]|uniref:Phage protein n=2 Tax=Citrobacter freundii TaxID=546 RepID=A0ABY7L4D4_CITFR|nr:hypothetical protein [Citrobacter freundii]MCO5743587.1 hypothetical protein [Citrobacter freundii]MCO5749479.1 hypothetical protein [Citrobacter freundii]MCO5757436.1 hypothetical protein [Citrobacter freundii]MCO5764790.1 hypothetical protein [Citrobacter freundii]MCO5770282.1 hypothetical protein [Citrobacter freundii]